MLWRVLNSILEENAKEELLLPLPFPTPPPSLPPPPSFSTSSSFLLFLFSFLLLLLPPLRLLLLLSNLYTQHKAGSHNPNLKSHTLYLLSQSGALGVGRLLKVREEVNEKSLRNLQELVQSLYNGLSPHHIFFLSCQFVMN